MNYNSKKEWIEDIWDVPADSKDMFKPAQCKFINSLIKIVIEYGRQPLYAYARRMGIEPYKLTATLEVLTGMPANDWINRLICTLANHQLLYTTLSIEKIAKNVGFDKSNSFCKFYLRSTGTSPSLFRRMHQHIKQKTINQIVVD